MDGRDVDDPSESLGIHARQHRANQQERRFDHEREHGAEAFGAEVGDRVYALNPRVVDQDIRLQCEVLERADVEKIYPPSIPTDLFGDYLRGGLVHVGHRHAGAARREFPGTGRSDATRAAGDERGAAGQLRHPTTASRSAANCSASASSSDFRSMPLVSRVNSTATKVMAQAMAR